MNLFMWFHLVHIYNQNIANLSLLILTCIIYMQNTIRYLNKYDVYLVYRAYSCRHFHMLRVKFCHWYCFYTFSMELSILFQIFLCHSIGYLFELSHAIVYGSHFNVTTYEGGDVKLLKAITGPFTQYVIKVKMMTANHIIIIAIAIITFPEPLFTSQLFFPLFFLLFQLRFCFSLTEDYDKNFFGNYYCFR